ncbi:GNAT family N-acetyltransferase [Pedobacter cryoconitis]|uniref:Putative GNAT family acetyltransferase n=1 Tax=Pedobacter cryoconitis TaxID=188932 RepID=A0A7X0J7H4_9SPHI|nr:GNAT family N-acetyltransferase [Pedobacter cryoconitis]MBB6502513.1 putative GNAT family acetyltransferase [Pedobacter cryoconitis]
MDHILDNPAWNALISGNQELSNGIEDVKYFNKEVSPFVGLKENSISNFHQLYELIQHDSPVAFVNAAETQIPDCWKVLHLVSAYQMVYNQITVPANVNMDLISLKEENVPEMLALTQLTKPGPFAKKTIEMGHYQGIFEDGKLVAMAGQRLHPSPYAEISAVCTHPEYLGKGYAKQLLLSQVHRIKAKSEIPFLHVRHDNERAIQVYESLGFSTRKEVYFYFLQKEKMG